MTDTVFYFSFANISAQKMQQKLNPLLHQGFNLRVIGVTFNIRLDF